MTVGTSSGVTGYETEVRGKITNDTIVDGRTDRGVIDDQFRYPWSGYVVKALSELTNDMAIEFEFKLLPKR